MRRLALRLLALTLLATACGDGGTPASSDPLDARIEQLFPADPPFGTVDRLQVRRMLEVPPEDDGPFYMVNLIRHRQHAVYADGRPTDRTGAEADAIYGAQILPILASIGARPVFVADVEQSLIDLDGAEWDQVGVVEYPSRARFFEMLEREDFRAAAVHKQAGVEKTLVLVAQTEGAPLPEILRRVDLESVPFPPTEDDPPIAVVHLIDYNDVARYADGRATDLTGREAMQLYEQARDQQGVLELGVRPGLWLTIEGELIGDGRGWEEFRINNFPSRATFASITTAESLEQAGIEHRVAALRESYSLRTAPILSLVGYR